MTDNDDRHSKAMSTAYAAYKKQLDDIAEGRRRPITSDTTTGELEAKLLALEPLASFSTYRTQRGQWGACITTPWRTYPYAYSMSLASALELACAAMERSKAGEAPSSKP